MAQAPTLQERPVVNRVARNAGSRLQLIPRVGDAFATGAALDRAIRLLCTLWVGVMAGFFFAFSVVVMPGFDDADPLTAMAAMQAINDAVQNAVFFLGFFGAPLLCAAVIVGALVRHNRMSVAALVAAVVYLVGVFGVTVAFNVPLNEDLAALDPTLPENTQAMRTYIDDWTAWNHVRTVSGILAFGLLAGTLVAGRVHQEDHGPSA